MRGEEGQARVKGREEESGLHWQRRWEGVLGGRAIGVKGGYMTVYVPVCVLGK